MNVYLAGKVSERCWRHQYVDHLGWNSVDSTERWPILKNAIQGKLNYCGPFFSSGDGHGGSHGDSTHGQGDCNRLPLAETEQKNVFNRCVESLHIADAMIAVVTPDSYGTLVEIGYFKSLQTRNNRKRLFVICSDNCFVSNDGYSVSGGHIDDFSEYDRNDLWFASVCGDSPVASVDEAIEFLVAIEDEKSLIDLCESPVERIFFEEFRNYCSGRNVKNMIRPQVKAGRYRIDFGDEKSRIGIEIDGHAYHSTKEQIRNDMQRQRELAEMGWVIHRFTGSEIHNSALKCAGQAFRLLAKGIRE